VLFFLLISRERLGPKLKMTDAVGIKAMLEEEGAFIRAAHFAAPAAVKLSSVELLS
jgi:hypothetical protein